jgi:hypothetical protein
VSSAGLPKTLVESLVKGTVIPFVGAGVSMAVQRKDGTPAFPSWKGLLLRAAERIQAEGRTEHSVVRAMLEQTQPDYIESARWARKGLGSHWATFLGECFGITRKEVDDQSLELARRLWQLGSRLVITTNYDRVLRWACADAGDIDEWPIEAPAGQVAALRRALVNPTVWHLHGSLTDPTKIILSPDGYEQLYTDDSQASRYRTALETLRGLMAMDHLLFVGFSLDDPFLKRQLEWVRDTFQGCTGPHYVMARKSEIEGMRGKVEGLDLGFVEFEDFGGPMLSKLDELVAVRMHVETTTTLVMPPAADTRVDPPRVAPTRLPHLKTKLFGRDDELGRLDAMWNGTGAAKVNVVTLVAWGGVGKTSLVFEWMNRLAADGWRGARVVFDWSFYSQGVRDKGAPSGESFIAAALRYFGDEAMAESSASASDKGARLAELVGQQRALLVLDGLEPLQHASRQGVEPGTLTDPGVAALLHGLARTNPGLCVVTTREAVPSLAGFGEVVARWDLEGLSQGGADALLRYLLEEEPAGAPPVTSTPEERAEVWTEVKGHALTLQLLGRYIRRALGDFRRWREVKLHDADHTVQGDHAFRVMAAYERWLSGELAAKTETTRIGWWARVRAWLGGSSGSSEPTAGQRQLAVLRMLGLFDRPADPGCIGVLCSGSAIKGLTEPLVGLDVAGWRSVVSQLAALGLVSREAWEPVRIEGFPKDRTDLDTGETTGAPEVKVMPEWPRLTESLDAHPLVREHFRRRVRQTSEAAWKEGHRRVFEHLCESTPHWPEGTQGLGPLYQAVVHGCQAGEVEKARAEVYRDRILRGTSGGGFYSMNKLGLVGADLGAVAWFFESPWSRPSPSLPEGVQTWLLHDAAFHLRALGRLAEAVGPMRAGLERRVEQKNWKQAARVACNLSELELTRGEVTEASHVAEQSVTFADRSADAFMQMVNRAIHADTLHQAGRRDEARRRFEEAEAMQAERQPSYPRLYSVQGFRYCDLLLFGAEHAAWRETLARGEGSSMPTSGAVFLGGARSSTPNDTMAYDRALAACDEALGRAAELFEWHGPGEPLLDVALDHLTLGRASLYRALLAAPVPDPASGPAHLEKRRPAAPTTFAVAKQHVDTAVEGLRRSGQMDCLPCGLLSRAWLHHLLTNPTAATIDLDEAESLATRSGMPIFLADVHLTRARLFRDRIQLAKAKKLLATLATKGYHRHDEMLADAEEAARHWPESATRS